MTGLNVVDGPKVFQMAPIGLSRRPNCPLQICWETGHSPSWAQVGSGVPQLDAVHGVLREEARDAAREPQTLDRGIVDGETAA